MFAAQEPASNFIVLAHHQPDFFQNGSLEAQVEALVGILKSEIPQQSLSTLSVSLHERIFDLRIEAIHFFYQEQISFRALMQNLEKVVDAKSHHNNTLQQLGTTLQLVLKQYKKIVANYIKDMDFDGQGKDIFAALEEKPRYDMFKTLAMHPDNRVKFIKKWADESLNLEFALLVAQLRILGEIEMPLSQVRDELIPFLKQTITRLGAYSIFIGFWTPKNLNEDQLMINTKILASTLELDYGTKNKQLAHDSFHALLQN